MIEVDILSQGRVRSFCPLFLLAMKPRRAQWDELIGMFRVDTQWVWRRDQPSGLPSAWDSAGHSFAGSSPHRQSLKSVNLHTTILSPPQLKRSKRKLPLAGRSWGKVPCNIISSVYISHISAVCPRGSSSQQTGIQRHFVQQELTLSCSRFCCSIMRLCRWKRESQKNFLSCSI